MQLKFSNVSTRNLDAYFLKIKNACARSDRLKCPHYNNLMRLSAIKLQEEALFYDNFKTVRYLPII